MQKHILIIGGMGPQASIHAHKRLIETYQEHYQNTGNSDYPRITHLSLNVEDFISDETKKEAAKNYILTCLKEIDMSSVDVGLSPVTLLIYCMTTSKRPPEASSFRSLVLHKNSLGVDMLVLSHHRQLLDNAYMATTY